jgi:NAD(P)H-hydrate repair Nnr-like enzyme with NAD(P)H-hydrate epimerase domain
MMAARLLAEAGLQVTTLLLGAPGGFGADVTVAWGELLASAAPGTVRVVETAQDLATHNDALIADLIVDAVVGTGFKPPLKGLALAALEWVKTSKASMLAVDLPSGWEADSTSAAAAGPAFDADAVITFTAPKPAHVFGQLTGGGTSRWWLRRSVRRRRRSSRS